MNIKNKAAYKIQLQKALKHLEYSFAKVPSTPTSISKIDEEELARWESLTARFSRIVDIFIGKFLRFAVLEQDPGFEGFVRDFLNAGEKLGLIHDVNEWLDFRAVRNRIAHEYLDDQLEDLFKYIHKSTPIVIREIKRHATN